MSGLAEPVLWPGPPPTTKSRIAGWALDRFDVFARVLRRVWPIPRGFGRAAVLRFEDVVEVFARDRDFPVDYRGKLDVIMGGQPFFLGMDNTDAYRRDIGVLRQAMRVGDAAGLAAAAERRSAEIVAASGGRLEVVQAMRDIAFDVLGRYFGVTAPEGANLQAWATHLFAFQFADPGNDPALRQEVDRIAPLLRAHIDSLIAARCQTGGGDDDVLGRLLALQAAGVPGTEGDAVRSALLGLVVGGPPQPPMVTPQALNQLLDRPDVLAAARAAAASDDDAALAGIVNEAMRFDPLAPGLFRRAAVDTTIGLGRPRAARVKAGTRVFVAFRSAMQDPLFVADPSRFDPGRPADQYIHFGHGLHTCFGIHVNRVMLPAMLKPILARPNLRRAPGAAGRLTKRGGFSDQLTVEFDPVNPAPGPPS